jgi:NaMN:DMB phosphoribosyltransferase
MDETMVNETIDETTTVDEFYDDVEDAGVLGKVLLGGAAVAVGVAGGFAVKNKDKIKAFFDEKKENHRRKKVAKTMERLAKLEAKAPKPVEEAEKEE